uniref:Chromophore lyase CpcS/CpeS n=1 Tax=Lithothamnion sp. TaxID=1940749 RepID=A0A3G3MGG7_9FLOR|nr:hypothetical protein [Lithothamnion sp.]
MDSKFFINKIEGNWIIQSTNYSLIKNTISTSINHVFWKKIKNTNNEIILKNRILKFPITDRNVYIIESSNQKRNETFYKVFLCNEKMNKGSILKINYSGCIVSQAFFNYKNNQYCHINYQYDNFNIAEKVYFINPNLKIIKSIITKNDMCIGISFSSEIKIN